MRHLLSTLALLIGLGGYAQQLPQYSQYMINDYVLNPAIAGSQDHFQSRLNLRKQWTGIEGAPSTYILSVYGPHQESKTGLGGYVFGDVTGPTSRMGAMLSYAYHLQLNDQMKLGFGLFAGVTQFKINAGEITLYDEGDMAFNNNAAMSALVPDVNFGTYLYGEKYRLGISANQLLHNKLDLNGNKDNQLQGHYFVMGGYDFDINEEVQLTPSFLLKYSTPAPMQVDIGVKATYRKMLWAGLSYRTADALAILIGYDYQKKAFLGYSYDLTSSNLKNYSSGTHEIMLGMRFGNTGASTAQSE